MSYHVHKHVVSWSRSHSAANSLADLQGVCTAGGYLEACRLAYFELGNTTHSL